MERKGLGAFCEHVGVLKDQVDNFHRPAKIKGSEPRKTEAQKEHPEYLIPSEERSNSIRFTTRKGPSRHAELLDSRRYSRCIKGALGLGTLAFARNKFTAPMTVIR